MFFRRKELSSWSNILITSKKYLTQRIVTRKTSPTKGRARGSTKNGIVKILQNSVMNAFGFYGCIGSEHFHVGPYALI
jgi:hypothetical protein